MQPIEMIPQHKNRTIPPFIGIAGTNDMCGEKVIIPARVGTVPLYTESDILQFGEATGGWALFIILRTEDGKKYHNLQEFYKDRNKGKLLKE